MAMELEALTRPVPKWVIDRIEEGWAVLENTSTLESINLPQSQLPEGVKPGDMLVRQNGKWYLDHAGTKSRAEDVHERFARIKARQS